MLVDLRFSLMYMDVYYTAWLQVYMCIPCTAAAVTYRFMVLFKLTCFVKYTYIMYTCGPVVTACVCVLTSARNDQESTCVRLWGSARLPCVCTRTWWRRLPLLPQHWSPQVRAMTSKFIHVFEKNYFYRCFNWLKDDLHTCMWLRLNALLFNL